MKVLRVSKLKKNNYGHFQKREKAKFKELFKIQATYTNDLGQDYLYLDATQRNLLFIHGIQKRPLQPKIIMHGPNFCDLRPHCKMLSYSHSEHSRSVALSSYKRVKSQVETCLKDDCFKWDSCCTCSILCSSIFCPVIAFYLPSHFDQMGKHHISRKRLFD